MGPQALLLVRHLIVEWAIRPHVPSPIPGISTCASLVATALMGTFVKLQMVLAFQWSTALPPPRALSLVRRLIVEWPIRPHVPIPIPSITGCATLVATALRDTFVKLQMVIAFRWQTAWPQLVPAELYEDLEPQSCGC